MKLQSFLFLRDKARVKEKRISGTFDYPRFRSRQTIGEGRRWRERLYGSHKTLFSSTVILRPPSVLPCSAVGFFLDIPAKKRGGGVLKVLAYEASSY